MTNRPDSALPAATDAGPLAELRARTPARVGLRRAGVSLTTADLLAFQVDHALARDAVHAPFEVTALTTALLDADVACVVVETMSSDRPDYLRHPGRGRELDAGSRSELAALRTQPPWDVAVVVSDGLSAKAANDHAMAVLAPLVADLRGRGLSVAPVVVAPFGRVGLLDDVGAALAARAAVIVIGERPGLSAADNLSIYLEVGPRPGLTDADRNCLSNISPTGLPPQVAAARATTLIQEGLRLGVSGTALKPEFPELPARPQT